MTTRRALLAQFGTPEKVSEYFRELQKKSRKNYKGTGGFGSKKVGKDGLTGKERSKKINAERKKAHEKAMEELSDV